VTIERFAMSAREVTRAEFDEFVAATGYRAGASCWNWSGMKPVEARGADFKNPGFPQTDRDPVVCVSWQDAQAYAEWMARTIGLRVRLPTEAEWEYAARAGTTTSRYWGDNPNYGCEHANVLDNTARRVVAGTAGWIAHLCDDSAAYTAPVGSYEPNAWGLYDMLGNVWEWVEDCHASYAKANPRTDAAEQPCAARVARGGAWIFGPRSVRAAARVRAASTVRNNVTGFRLAASIP